MTWLKLIFPFYLLMLTCTPCADKGGDIQYSPAKIYSQAQQCPDQHTETCTPLCSCCSQYVAFTKFFSVKAPARLTIEKKQPAVHSFALQNVLKNIWQPPQLV